MDKTLDKSVDCSIPSNLSQILRNIRDMEKVNYNGGGNIRTDHEKDDIDINRNQKNSLLDENKCYSCNQTFNANESYEAIQCDDCDLWFHLNCVGVSNFTQEELNNLKWSCLQCTNKKDIDSKNRSIQITETPRSMNDSCSNLNITIDGRDTKCNFCSKYFKGDKGLSIHISKTHGSEYRKAISSQYTNSQNSSPRTNNEDNEINKINKKLNHFKEKFENLLNSDTENKDDFLTLFDEYLSELQISQDHLPAPTHPAKRYYKMRQNQRLFVKKPVAANFQKSSNPERCDKNRRSNNKKQYQAQLIQHYYYFNRKRCVNLLMNDNEQQNCKASIEDIQNSFSERWSRINDNVRYQYEQPPNMDEQKSLNDNINYIITNNIVENALKGMNTDSSPGPDKIYVKTLKMIDCCDTLASIFSYMYTRNIIPNCLRTAKTILIYKNGEQSDPNNFRPISICSVIRRLFERIISRQLEYYYKSSEFQSGSSHCPGTYINTSILDGCLKKAKKQKDDLMIIFLDIQKAYEMVGHKHLENTLRTLHIPDSLRNMLLNLINRNCTQIETNGKKSQDIFFNRGLFQGSPLSSILFNLSIDHILKDLSEHDVSSEFGYYINQSLEKLSIMGFMDDTMLIANSKESGIHLYKMSKDLFSEIGLNLNINKTQCLLLDKGKLDHKTIQLDENDYVTTLQHNQVIKYLGINFNDEITLDKDTLCKNLITNLNCLGSSPLLNGQQKLNIMKIYIWPKFIYPLQSANLKLLPQCFLENLDKIIRSSTKEILQLPSDYPSMALYSSTKKKGIGLIRSKWEGPLQVFNIANILLHNKNKYVKELRNLEKDIEDCLTKLNIIEEYNNLDKSKLKIKDISGKLREILRDKEYQAWCKLECHGRGVVIFQQCESINNYLFHKNGMSSSEWINYLKLIPNVIASRTIPGRSTNGFHCRRCSEHYETLAHILGYCPFGLLQRNSRHHTIRSLIADYLKKSGLEVFEEIHCIAENESNRRVDIIALDWKKHIGYIIDPTIRLENSLNQSIEVDTEKKNIYIPCVKDLKEKYKFKHHIEVIGLFIGARGTISEFCSKTLTEKLKLPKSVCKDIALAAVKGSVSILKHHLYNPKI